MPNDLKLCGPPRSAPSREVAEEELEQVQHEDVLTFSKQGKCCRASYTHIRRDYTRARHMPHKQTSTQIASTQTKRVLIGRHIRVRIRMHRRVGSRPKAETKPIGQRLDDLDRTTEKSQN